MLNEWPEYIEYEFILKDGTKRYEFCGSSADVQSFMKMHRAKTAWSAKASADASAKASAINRIDRYFSLLPCEQIREHKLKLFERCKFEALMKLRDALRQTEDLTAGQFFSTKSI